MLEDEDNVWIMKVSHLSFLVDDCHSLRRRPAQSRTQVRHPIQPCFPATTEVRPAEKPLL